MTVKKWSRETAETLRSRGRYSSQEFRRRLKEIGIAFVDGCEQTRLAIPPVVIQERKAV